LCSIQHLFGSVFFFSSVSSYSSKYISKMEQIRKDMLEDEDDNDEEYLDRLREGNGSGLVNTRIADRESEVKYRLCELTYA